MSNLQSRILLVEGDDDKHFVKNFCWKMLRNQLVCKFTDDDNESDSGDSTQMFYIPDRSRQEGGIDNMIRTISTEIKEPGREVVGILADANGQRFDCSNHPWQKIRSKLEEVLDFEDALPELPCHKGLIRRNVRPKQKPKSTLHVGVWLMPDNQSSGELENFFAGLIHENNRTWPLAKEYINQYTMEQAENRQGGLDVGKPYKVSKAEVYAWLATRKQPGKMGAVISEGHGLNFDSELARRFAQWLKDLFCF
ncbi:MAG: hypothetical protein F4Z75_10090 [Synechococcus sp. SB0668_bin_15]|nr:hypothetical protein [Synechococcus sp. SB0668_bin_15]MXZ83879.1 hypothetical protein [Synechococcus sp. SB0666_bin_14]MYC50371.1 hypothetical protein [Synechococcus sp. SB0662_bin_14]MYG47646.1 hypothetical protein [Synechococcus sp. SB0675_bin_6]MYJ59412.1 hypothetical protein [Synechococcus sp. SB0672_bin_6]